MTSKPVPDDLRELADAHGVATRYRNERRESVDVEADVRSRCWVYWRACLAASSPSRCGWKVLCAD